MQREYQSMPSTGNSFLQSQNIMERLPSVSEGTEQLYQRPVTSNLDMSHDIQQAFSRVTRDSLALDKISFQDPSKPRATKILLSFRESLNEFALVKVSDDFLIRERKYLEHRRAKILDNLKTEIDRISTVNTEDLSLKERSGKQQQFAESKLGKNLSRHYKKVFAGLDLSPKECLSWYIESQLVWLREQQESLSNAIFGNRKQRAPSDVQNLLASQNMLQQLGDSRPQVISNASDERMYLEQKKAEIREFEELVFKLNVVIERVNFYTTEIIFPRDQNLEIIPFFDHNFAVNNSQIGPRSAPQKQIQNLYDFQSCLKVISVTKAQIERLEFVEIYLGSVESPTNLLNLSSSTLSSQDLRESKRNPDFEINRRKFNALRTDMKEKKTISSESNKALMDLLVKFTATDRLDPSLQLMLHMEVTNIRPDFENEGFRLEQQLYYMPKKPFSQLYRIEGMDQRLFTEINFFDHLVMNDFVMIFKLYKEINTNVFEKDRVIPNSKEKARHRFYRAFAVVNLFDLIIEDLLKCGKPYRVNLIRFYDVQQGQCIEELYPAFCTEYRKEEVSSKNKFQYSQLITTHLKLKMQLTFLTRSNPAKLHLRLDQTLVCRPKRFWEKMVRFQSDEASQEMRDLLANQKQELDEFNLNIMQSQDVHNYVRVDLRSLHLKEKAHRVQHIMRIQVYLYTSDGKNRSSINIRFLENFYRYPNERQNLEHFYQSNIASLNIGRAEFYNQFYVKLPSKSSLQELEKLKLVFLIQFPSDAMKTTEKITEQHIESDPSRFQFKTYYFARKPLYDSMKNQFAGISENGASMELQVMECRLSGKQKSFLETFETEQTVVKDVTLTVQMYLISQQYATNASIRQLIESNHPNPLSSQQVLALIQNISSNDILIYHQRLLDSLIYMFLNVAGESDKQDVDNIHLAIVTIIEKFNSKELQVYKSLIKDYQKKWDGVDRENDKKLFKVLEQKVIRIQEELHNQLENHTPFQPNKTQEMSLILSHLPTLLSFLFKLFSKEFEIQYAQIRQLINQKFKLWLDRDLCVYRPDIFENNFVPKRFQTSRPQLLIIYLEEDIKKITRAFIELKEKQMKEKTSNESDGGENNFTTEALEGDQFCFDDRISEYQSKRSTFREEARGTVEMEIHLKKLDSLLQTLKRFNLDFSLKIKNCVLGISQELHEALDFDSKVGDEENFIERLLDFKNLIRTPLEIYYCKRTPLREAFWRSLNDTLQTMVNFVDPNFVRALFDENHLLSTIQPSLPHLIRVLIPDFESRNEKTPEWKTKQVKLLFKKNLKAQAVLSSDQDEITIIGSTGVSIVIKLDAAVETGVGTKPAMTKEQELQYSETADDYETKIKDASAAEVNLRQEEEMQIDDDILLRVTMLSDILSSDAFLLLPNEINVQKQTLQNQAETLHEVLAANISKSVFNHIKAFKNAKKDNGDTKIVEMTMYFLFQMNEFESKLIGNLNQNLSLVQPAATNLSVLIADAVPMNQEEINPLQASFDSQDSYKEVEEEPLWAALSKNAETNFPAFANNETGERYSTLAENQIIVEVHEEEDENLDMQNLGLKNLQHRSNFQPELTKLTNKLGQALKNNLMNSQSITNQSKNRNTFLMESMKQGLGAKQEFNFKEQDLLLLDFENGKEKRLAFFLRETEEVFSRKKELSQLSLQHLKRLEEKYISLFKVQTMQHLQALNQNSFKLYYEKRPGCLNRLVREVRQAKIDYSTGFDDHEFFFKVKVLQVIEQFCENVIHFLCNPLNKRYISDLNDKYTYKSIVSQTWLLQLSLWAEEATQCFGFRNKMSLFFQDDSAIVRISSLLLERMKRHSENQELLWNTYEDMGDMILPENSNAIYTGIQDKIKAILKSDLEDPVLETAIYLQLQKILGPLAQIYAQIDELSYKCHKTLSSSVQTNFEKFIREMIEVDKNTKPQILNEKRKRVCDLFCELHLHAISQLQLQDPKFKELITQRSQDFFEIKKLYLDVIKYEKKDKKEKEQTFNGNLLAQLISFYSLMEKLQERNLSVSFQSHIKLKYKSLIQNINNTLYEDFLLEKQRAEKDPDNFVCQKNAQLYEDQMREVKAFMHVQDYITYKNAISAGEMATLGNQNLKQQIIIIDQAVRSLVNEGNKNQFFDVALSLLSDKRTLLEKTYKFQEITDVLDEQKRLYSDYEKFEKRQMFCKYYRVDFEPLMPEELEQKNRIFIYRTPVGYQMEFLRDDIALLLGHRRDKNYQWEGVKGMSFSQACSVKPVQPLTAEIKQKYGVPKEIMELAEVAASNVGLDDIGAEFCLKVKQYYLDNFKKHFYTEELKSAPSTQKGNLEIANFKDEYNLTIYEVKQAFPTMTMIQTVQRVYEKKVTYVQIQLWEVQQMIREIQSVIREDQAKSTGQSDAVRAVNLHNYVHKYITGDDVAGGIPVIIEKFFHKSLALEFDLLDNVAIKRAYLELFKNLEIIYQELYLLVEVYALYSRNPVGTSSALERLEKRSKDLQEKRVLFNLQQLQENF